MWWNLCWIFNFSLKYSVKFQLDALLASDKSNSHSCRAKVQEHSCPNFDSSNVREHASSNFLRQRELRTNYGSGKLTWDRVIFCGVRISIPRGGVVNNGANNNKLTTLAQCLRPCHIMTYLSCNPLVFKLCVFRDSHELFIAHRYLTVICNVLWLTICSFLLFCI